MIGLALKLLSFLPNFTTQVADYLHKRADVELQGFKTGTEADTARYQAWLSAQVEINRMKLAANAWWGAKLIILIAGVPAAAHFGAVMLDSIPFPYLWLGDWFLPYFGTHKVGSWGIPKLPAPYDGYQWAIVQSFFIVMPVQTLSSAAGQWLARKR
jgi:hypothetical protein